MFTSLSTIGFNSIKTRLVTFFLLFGVVPAVCLIAVYFSFKGAIEDAFRAPVSAKAVSIGDVIDRNLFERYGDVQAFGANAAAWAPENWRNPSAANPLIAAINAYMTNYGLYRLMILVGPDGSVLAVNSVDPLGKALDTSGIYEMNFAGASWFKKAVAGEFLRGKNGLTGTVVEQPANNPIVANVYKDDGYTLTFAAPVKNVAGEAIGVWVNFADFGLVEEIVSTFYKGFAARGLDAAEIVVLDPQGNVIVDLDPKSHGENYKRDPAIIGKYNLVTEGVAPAIAATRGESGVMLATHTRKHIEQAVGYAHTIGAYAYPGLGWSVLVRIEDTAINAVANQVALWMQIALVVSVVVIALLAWLIGRNIAGSISGMTEAMRALAGGDKAIEVPGVGRKDEIGGMAGALQVFKDQALEVDRMQVAAKEAEKRAEEDKRRSLHALADGFQASVGKIVMSVTSASTQLQSTAQTMAATADETGRQSVAVAAASEEATTNVQTIAAATEELTASISEISRQVAEASQITSQAVEDAKKTDATVRSLSDAAQKIGNVVQLINDIASQTNLLALNATIEAARAGEAGKGFAVVASEVKSLATQTAKATDEIGGQIKAMQSVTDEAVTAIRNIAATIDKISAISTAIAGAVGQQGEATKEIARNVDQAAVGTKEVTRNVDGVSQAAIKTGASANEVLKATQTVATSAAEMTAQIDGFLQKVKAA